MRNQSKNFSKIKKSRNPLANAVDEKTLAKEKNYLVEWGRKIRRVRNTWQNDNTKMRSRRLPYYETVWAHAVED